MAPTFALAARDPMRAIRAAIRRFRQPRFTPVILAKSVADHAACVLRRVRTPVLSDEQTTTSGPTARRNQSVTE